MYMYIFSIVDEGKPSCSACAILLISEIEVCPLKKARNGKRNKRVRRRREGGREVRTKEDSVGANSIN